MANTLNNFAVVLRSLVSLTLLALVGSGGWLVYQHYDNNAEMERKLREQTVALEKLKQEKERLELAMRLLKVDHRVAEINVLNQRNEGDRPTTEFEFVELSTDGTPIGEKKTFTVVGDRIYVDAWVIKFDDALVEQADPLRTTSVCLFRRVFGEYQEPDKGFPLDAKGTRPAAYSQGNEMSPLERDMWTNFWEYANNPAKARSFGVRAIHGEAPNIKLQPDKRYRVELRASGGLSIVAEDVPPRDAA